MGTSPVVLKNQSKGVVEELKPNNSPEPDYSFPPGQSWENFNLSPVTGFASDPGIFLDMFNFTPPSNEIVNNQTPGTQENPATVEQILENPETLIKPGIFYTHNGKVSEMKATNYAETRAWLASQIGIPKDGSDPRNPVSAEEIVRNPERFAERIEKGQDIHYYLTKSPRNVEEVNSTVPQDVMSYLAKEEGIGLSGFPGREIVKTEANRTLTGYSREDGWDERNAARRWLYKGKVSTVEEAIKMVEAGVPIDKIPPVLMAQSRDNPSHQYGTRTIIEFTEGRLKGIQLPGIILDCGAFGSNHYDLYTNSTSTARAITSSKGKMHILN